MGFIAAGEQPQGVTTVVLPMLSTGHVAQLAVDVLVENLNAKRIGYLDHEGVLPMVGNLERNDGSTEMITSADVYSAAGITIVQLRAPVAKASRSAFRAMLMDWIAAAGFTKVVILAGLNAVERIESQLTGTQMRALLSPGLAAECENLAGFGCPALEARLPTPTVLDGVFVHGGGLTRTLFNECSAQGLDTAAILHFCLAGDTRREGMVTAAAVARWLALGVITPAEPASVLPDGWQMPRSWARCYGAGPRAGLF